MDKQLDWTCARGHVLGQVRRNGRDETVLLLYREAVNPRHPGKKPVEILGELHGSMLGISCSICSKRRTWGAAPPGSPISHPGNGGEMVRLETGVVKGA